MGNNITIAIKRLFTNKNTVTIIGVLLGVVVLYVGYNMRIEKEINPQSVPYAKKLLNPGTKITSDVIGEVEVPPAMLKGEAYKKSSDVVGKYVNADSIIPAGSLFYDRCVRTKEELPASIIHEIPDGYSLVNFAVDTSSTYGNAIYPGNYIDIYLKIVYKGTDDTILAANANKMQLGKLVENVKVLAVLDASGQSVFANLDENRTPAMIIFAVPEEYHILLRKAMYLRTYEATLIPVPTNESLKDEKSEVTVSNESLKDFINTVTVWDQDINQVEDDVLNQ